MIFVHVVIELLSWFHDTDGFDLGMIRFSNSGVLQHQAGCK